MKDRMMLNASAGEITWWQLLVTDERATEKIFRVPGGNYLPGNLFSCRNCQPNNLKIFFVSSPFGNQPSLHRTCSLFIFFNWISFNLQWNLKEIKDILIMTLSPFFNFILCCEITYLSRRRRQGIMGQLQHRNACDEAIRRWDHRYFVIWKI